MQKISKNMTKLYFNEFVLFPTFFTFLNNGKDFFKNPDFYLFYFLFVIRSQVNTTNQIITVVLWTSTSKQYSLNTQFKFNLMR